MHVIIQSIKLLDQMNVGHVILLEHLILFVKSVGLGLDTSFTSRIIVINYSCC